MYMQYANYGMQMINLMLEIWLKYAGNMKFTLKYIACN